jgi:hypothetical protein
MDSHILYNYLYPQFAEGSKDLPELLGWNMPDEVIIVDNTKAETKRVRLYLH